MTIHTHDASRETVAGVRSRAAAAIRSGQQPQTAPWSRRVGIASQFAAHGPTGEQLPLRAHWKPVRRCVQPNPMATAICAVLIALCLWGAAGCSRQHYRRQADAEVLGLLAEKSNDPRWELHDYRFTPHRASRMYDPTSPDCPPMPPDDPASHQLMHRVDCKPGYKHWHRHGNAMFVENPDWRSYLPCNDQGVLVLDRRLAMQVALVNSREYQTELEDLYLSALDVTFQRFRFDAQFFLTNQTFYQNNGPKAAGGASRRLSSDTEATSRKLGIAGSELVVGFANSLVWQFAGPDDRTARSIIDFSLVQPLLRGAGRAVVMENLTDSERALLANVRQMEQFRRAFYVNVIAGRASGPGPGRGGLLIDALTPTTPSSSGGIYTLLSDQIRIRNQRVNVSGLRDSLDQIQAHYDAGRIDRLQLDVARQALFNAQNRLLSLQTAYDNRLDAYKIQLGLPPDVETRVEDDLLKPFDLVDPSLIAISDQVTDLIDRMRDPPEARRGIDLRQQLPQFADGLLQVDKLLEADRKLLDRALPSRRKQLAELSRREEVLRGDADSRAYSVELLERRAADLNRDMDLISSVLKQVADELRQTAQAPGNDEQTLPLLIRTSNLLLNATLLETALRLDTVTLTPVDLDPAEAYITASQQRLDWMNARAALVDVWRQIEVTANALKSNLDVVLDGDVSTTDNNPFRFQGTTGRMRVGFRFDAPLTRLIERNQYREALIRYQRARRAYYAYEDRISQNLRSTLRAMRQAQLDFELRRAGVLVAVSQVDITRERLTQPPKPGAAAQATTFGATTARDLVQAYQGLLNAQDNFLLAWVEYEANRLNLDFELGTMRLDTSGMWIDPGPIQHGYGQAPGQPDEPEPNPELIAPPEPIELNQPIAPPAPQPEAIPPRPQPIR